MPAPLVDTSEVTLDETEERYLDSKGTSTAKAYRSNLKRFRVYYPAGLVGLIKQIEQEREANKDIPVYERSRPGEKIISGFVDWHRESGYSNKATLQALHAIQNALKYYGISISLAFIETPPDRPMKENKKHEWTLDQVRQYVAAADYLREKAYILFAFQSGLGISDILALNYGDIQKEYEAGILPLAIEGYRQKTGQPIRTFIGADAVRYLRLYLSSRPDIKPGDPLFTFHGNDARRATPGAIQKMLRSIAEKLEFVAASELENGYSPVRSHSLRSGFRSRLTGKMDSDLIECFMAHDIGQQRSTYMNMPLSELRDLYANYEHLLAIERTSKDELAKSFVKTPEEFKAEIKILEKRILDLNKDIQQGRELQEKVLDQIEKMDKRISVLEQSQNR